jgi:hypothetical protein
MTKLVRIILLNFGLLIPAQAFALTAVSNLDEPKDFYASTYRYTNFPPQGSDLPFPGWQDAAVSFVPGSSTLLTDVTLPLAAYYPSDGFTVALHSDNGNKPGTILLQFIGESNPTVYARYTYTAPSPFPVEAAVKYWIVAKETGTLARRDWDQVGAGFTGLPGWSIGNLAYRSNWVSQWGNSEWSTKISIGIVPEPCTGFLAVTALSFFAMPNRRRRAI